MVVIAAIGAFFKKIWDWIRQTAWIQPLLIVGIIFAIIFSIKPIVDAVNASKTSAKKSSAFYHNYQYSLRGKEESEADKLTSTIEKIMVGKDETTQTVNINGKNVDKFFLCYVAETCEQCEAARGGFDYFEKNFGENGSKLFKPNDNSEFAMVTIFADEVTDESDKDQTAFVKYLDRHQSFFEECGSQAYQTPYCENKPLSGTDLEYLSTADPDNFLTPTILLVELNKDKIAAHTSYSTRGVTEVMFGVDGENDSDKAKTLLDCWNHTGKFSFEESK